MYLLITDKEISQFLLSLINFRSTLNDVPILWIHTSKYIMSCDEKYFKDKKFIPKFKERLKKAIYSDLDEYLNTAKEILYLKRKQNYQLIHKNVEYFIDRIGKEKILDAYKKSEQENFVKSAGLLVSNDSKLIRRKDYTDNSKDCFFRNMEGNEIMLLDKMKNNYPFWFIDTGYTNFLESNKKWHRLVRNNLHHSKILDVPVDRLGCFKEFPKIWRTSGEKILIIEPGKFSAATFDVDIEKWRKSIVSEIRKYTDKQIIFREKLNKKVRSNLYRELLDEDYYCVININSNAAVEAIWAGIPAITLHKHISNPVTRNTISDINNLYRPNLANWLCSLSYSQFTYEEILNGTAGEIVKKHHV